MNEYLPERSLDEFLAALRSEAHRDEIAGEASVLDAMSSSLFRTEKHNVIKLTKRAPRIAAIVAASVLAVGGLAAAAPGTFLSTLSRPSVDEAPSASRPPFDLAPRAAQTSVEATTTTTSSTSTTSTSTPPVEDDSSAVVAPDSESPDTFSDDPATEFDETLCADGNHGKTVSSVAHSVEPGPDHGDAVSEAAHSSCGRSETEPDSVDVELDGPTEEDPDDQLSVQPGDDGRSQGNGQGKNDNAGTRSDNGKNKRSDKSTDDD